ncbi:MAG: hypothetical protein QXG00_08685 [Candidatus Woesearchaeota archaeon]
MGKVNNKLCIVIVAMACLIVLSVVVSVVKKINSLKPIEVIPSNPVASIEILI